MNNICVVGVHIYVLIEDRLVCTILGIITALGPSHWVRYRL